MEIASNPDAVIDLSEGESLLLAIRNLNEGNEAASQAGNMPKMDSFLVGNKNDEKREEEDNPSGRGNKKSGIENEINESLLFDITPEQNGGVMKQIVRPGEGADYPGIGDHVSVIYTGWLLNNIEKQLNFHSNLKSERNEFTLGEGFVFKGLEFGIPTMKKGEVAIFKLQHLYAYGAFLCPPPGSSTTSLYIKVELLEWEMEDFSPLKDKSILRKIIHRGIGRPINAVLNDGWQVKVNLVGLYKSKIFECGEKIFVLGEGRILNIPEGIELGVMHFRLQEKSILYLKSPYSYENGSEEHSIPAGADVAFEVTLLDVRKDKELWEMNSDEKLWKAKLCREKGIAFVEAGLYRDALKQFKWIPLCLENEPGVTSESEEREAVLIKGYLNMSLCYLKLDIPNEAIRICSKALYLDPQNEKALYRRGQAKMCNNDWYEATEDFNKLCCLSPASRIVERNIRVCQIKIREQMRKDKLIFCNMFQKFVHQDEARKRGLRTETGVWQMINQPTAEAPAKRDRREVPMNYSQRLYEQHNAVLRDANVIELSNTAHF